MTLLKEPPRTTNRLIKMLGICDNDTAFNQNSDIERLARLTICQNNANMMQPKRIQILGRP